MCSKKKSSQHKKQKLKSKLNFVSEDQEEDNNDNVHWPIFSLSGKHGRVKSNKISLTLEGETIEMDVDTGASISVISEQEYRTKLQKKVSLCPSNTILETYSGEL